MFTSIKRYSLGLERYRQLWGIYLFPQRLTCPNALQNQGPTQEERFTNVPEVPKNTDSVAAMTQRVKTDASKKFHAQLKHKPMLGITKEVMGGLKLQATRC